MTVRIIHGHVLDALASLDPESVQCVITSVPYWGLRSYKTEHQVWGGNQRCAHEFGEERPLLNKSGLHRMPPNKTGGTKDYSTIGAHRGQFCAWCGAWKGEHGLEPSLDLWRDHEVLIWRAIRRVLRKDGLAWLNVGDSYAGGGRGQDINSTLEGLRDNQAESRVAVRARTGAHNLKAKQRLMLPARLALALQADGWWIRDEIVWHKSNPMPSSVDDRTTPAHEMIYLLSKRARYFSDFKAIEEPFADSSIARLTQSNIPNQGGGDKQDQYDLEGYNNGSRRPNEIVQSLAARLPFVQTVERVPSGWDQEREGSQHSTLALNQGEKGNRRGNSKNGTPRIDAGARREGEPYSSILPSGKNEALGKRAYDGFNDRWDESERTGWAGTTRNKRSVWTIPTEPFSAAHFATFPTRLVEPMILAGTSARGACVQCGAPWMRVTLSEFQIQRDVARLKGDLRGLKSRDLTLDHGWYPTCGCDGLVKLPPLPPAREKEQRRTVLEVRRALCDLAAGIPTRPCVVLDPFFGSGTVGLVADKLDPPRDCVGVELNADYVEIARHRIAPLLVEVSKAAPCGSERVQLAGELGTGHQRSPSAETTGAKIEA